jgi:hypothetical protein
MAMGGQLSSVQPMHTYYGRLLALSARWCEHVLMRNVAHPLTASAMSVPVSRPTEYAEAGFVQSHAEEGMCERRLVAEALRKYGRDVPTDASWVR